MFDDPNQQPAQDPNAPQAAPPPPFDPYYIEQVRQEIEYAYEEFQRLLNGRPRYNRFLR